MDHNDFQLSLATINTLSTSQRWLAWLEQFESEPELFNAHFDYGRFIDDEEDGHVNSIVHSGLCSLIFKALSAKSDCVIEALGEALLILSKKPLWKDSIPAWHDIHAILQAHIDIDERMNKHLYPSWRSGDSAFLQFFTNVGPHRMRTANYLSALHDDSHSSNPEQMVSALAEEVFFELLACININTYDERLFVMSSLSIIRDLSLQNITSAIIPHNEGDEPSTDWDMVFGQHTRIPQAADYFLLMMIQVVYREKAADCLAMLEDPSCNEKEFQYLRDKYVSALAVTAALDWSTFEFTPTGIEHIDTWVKMQLEQCLANHELHSNTTAQVLKLLSGEPILS